MSFVNYARREFEILNTINEGKPDFNADDYQINLNMQATIMRVLEDTAKEGHSGGSIGWAISYLTEVTKKLLSFEPLAPLTGADDEWVDVSKESGYTLFQNKRCSAVFKDDTSTYYLYGKRFVDPSGVTFTTKNSHVDITFPYMPSTELIKVDDICEPIKTDVMPMIFKE